MSHLGCFRVKTSRNVHDVQRIVKEVLVCLSLLHKIFRVINWWNLVERCTNSVRTCLGSKGPKSDQKTAVLTPTIDKAWANRWGVNAFVNGNLIKFCKGDKMQLTELIYVCTGKRWTMHVDWPTTRKSRSHRSGLHFSLIFLFVSFYVG